ncbi:MAG: hypothetical protein DRP57_07455 [Spirochaetes bacterium]|nr:MAG: hypothetical protein DRP57_07455 [Spirochaetota bacterium]
MENKSPVINFLKKILNSIKWLVSVMGESHKNRVTELTAYEERELENIFILLLMGSFTGIPSPPAFLAVELFPYLEHELKILEVRAKDSSDALSELAGLLDID